MCPINASKSTPLKNGNIDSMRFTFWYTLLHSSITCTVHKDRKDQKQNKIQNKISQRL